jgi:hypothetical protein
MTISIWFFAVSAVILISMISYRNYELSSGKSLISIEKRRSIDNKTLRFIGKCNLFLKKTVIFVKNKCVKLSDVVHVFLHKAWKFISEKVDKYFDRLKGHRGGRHGMGSSRS